MARIIYNDLPLAPHAVEAERIYNLCSTKEMFMKQKEEEIQKGFLVMLNVSKDCCIPRKKLFNKE